MSNVKVHQRPRPLPTVQLRYSTGTGVLEASVAQGSSHVDLLAFRNGKDVVIETISPKDLREFAARIEELQRAPS